MTPFLHFVLSQSDLYTTLPGTRSCIRMLTSLHGHTVTRLHGYLFTRCSAYSINFLHGLYLFHDNKFA